MKRLLTAFAVVTALIAPTMAASPAPDAARTAMIGKWHDNADDPGMYWQFNADGTYDMAGMKGKWLLFSGAKPPKDATPAQIDTPDRNTTYLELKDSDGLMFYVVAHVDRTSMELDYIHGAGNGIHNFTRVTGKAPPRPTGY